jgi:hypothetical protein
VADFPASEFHLDGDPGAISASSRQWSQFGAAATDAAAEIRSLDSSLFIGPEGDMYRAGLDHDLPPHLDVTGRAYTKVGGALSAYSSALSRLQDRMTPLRVKAPGLWDALQQAQGRVSAAQTADHQHQLQVAADAASRPPGQAAPPDTYHSDLGTASASLSAAQQAWDDNLAAARAVMADLHTAVDTADRAIREAGDTRFAHNPHGFGALVAGIENFVKDHAAGLAKLSGVLKIVSGVCSVLSFIPVIDVVAAPLAIATGAAALAIDATLKVVTGQGSWTSLIVDGALTALPFGVGKLAGLARSAKLVRSAEGADGQILEEGLFAFGGKKPVLDENGNLVDGGFPRPPRDSDLHVGGPEEPVGPFTPGAPTDEVPGASTYTSVEAGTNQGLSGQVFRLPEGTELPPGYGVHADGADVGGNAPSGHRTIYPSQRMPAGDFQAGYGNTDFGWQWHGTVNKKGVFTPAVPTE